MIFIRTDANETIAAGHMMRCITVAEEMIGIGHETTFLLSDEESSMLLEERGFKYQVLHTCWSDLNTDMEVEKIIGILRDSFADTGDRPLILVDSYYVDNEYFIRLKDYAFTAIFDDLCKEYYDVDILINYNIFFHIHDYKKMYSNSRCRLLLGTTYTPLRKQFVRDQHVKPIWTHRKEIVRKRILVMSGGGDSLGALRGFMEYLISNDAYHCYDYAIIAGRYNPRISELNRMAEELPGVTLYENVADMAAVMKECDMAVSAASTVLYECCAMRLPTIFYCAADNQEDDIREFASNGMMLYAGDMRVNKADVYRCIFSHIMYLDNNPDVVTGMKKMMAKVTDGRGAARIAAELDRMIRSNRDSYA